LHKMVRGEGSSCVICSEYDSREPTDLNVLNFERFKFGGVRHLQPLYIWLDLTLFGKEKLEEPTSQDIDLLKNILDQLSSLSSKKLSDAEKAIKFPKSNKNERVGLISTLGYCGILNVPNYPCFYEEYISCNQREHSNYSKSDWPFPTDIWLPQYGINEKSVMHWFSDYL
jgi:hypothetical protein